MILCRVIRIIGCLVTTYELNIAYKDDDGHSRPDDEIVNGMVALSAWILIRVGIIIVTTIVRATFIIMNS